MKVTPYNASLSITQRAGQWVIGMLLLAAMTACGVVPKSPTAVPSSKTAVPSTSAPASAAQVQGAVNLPSETANPQSTAANSAPATANDSASPSAAQLNVSADKPSGWSESGIASWYGPRFHGKRTANGERFNTNELTAAHKTLPFGTRVLVKSLIDGKEVVVRINDRGPFIKGRIIDLSQAAAKAIGMAGVKRVEIARLN
jgi:rare lipoprotein A